MTLLLAAYLLPVVAVSAALCGHVGEAWPPGVAEAAEASVVGAAPNPPDATRQLTP